MKEIKDGIESRCNNPRVEKAIYDWAVESNAVLHSIDNEDGGLKVILSNVVCPNKGRAHANNKCYLHIKTNIMIHFSAPSRFVCGDASCKGYWWPGPNFSTRIYREEILQSLQAFLNS
jgi:hypothetical protein